MNLEKIIFFIILVLLSTGCKKRDDNKITDPPDGCINLSELETDKDYYLPFGLINNSTGIKSVILNGKVIDLSTGKFIEFTETGFYELILIYSDLIQENDTILFTTGTEEREDSEWGIRSWVPKRFDPVIMGQENVEIIYPHRYADSIKLPFIFYVKESGSIKEIYCKGKCLASGDTFNIKMGVGSVNISVSSISTKVDFRVGGKQFSVSPVKITNTDLELKGAINSPLEIPANSLVRITGNLTVSYGGSLTVGEGTIMLIDEGVDINLSGPAIFEGTAVNPVFVTCSRKNKFWGGFITRVAVGMIEAKYTIFSQSGYHDTEGYNWGHSGRQALFYTENSSLTLDHCFITDHIGQIFYPQNSSLVFDDILVQRAQTGGQINYSDLTIRNSVFTDFPDDSNVFMDEDNDALYLSASDAEIENTIFMFAKDDGLDSGNEEGGEINLTNCRFEACFHEGAALSSGNSVIKTHTFTECTFINCGQGLELGFSSPNHSVVADRCLFLYNGVGIRYGDNYEWSEVDGKMLIKNSFSLYNDKDVWNMVRKTWSPKIEKMSFENTRVSARCPQYPLLEIYSK
jgi:hypothetical protein